MASSAAPAQSPCLLYLKAFAAEKYGSNITEDRSVVRADNTVYTFRSVWGQQDGSAAKRVCHRSLMTRVQSLEN